MLRWLLIGIVAYGLYRLITNEIRKRMKDQVAAENQATTDTQREMTGNMAKDPVCGSYVDAAESISVRDGAKTYHFCSYDCRDAFLNQLRTTGRIVEQKTATSDTEDQDAFKQ